MQFNPGDGTGIIDLLGDLTGTQSATTNSYSLAKKTRDINSALDAYSLLANAVEGRWQSDDTNQLHQAVIYGDLVAGQQDYSFDTDQDQNFILNIYKIRVLGSDGITWHTIKQRDIQDKRDYLLNDTVNSANVTMYDISGNTISLTDIPNYSWRQAIEGIQGIEIWISRTPTYFTVSDTIKVPGFPVYHEYLAYRPAYFYCLSKGKDKAVQAASYYNILFGEDGKGGLEMLIKDWFAQRNRDERPRMTFTKPRIDPYFRRIGPSYGNDINPY